MDEERELELKDLLGEVRRIDVMSRRLVTSTLAGGYVSVFRGAGLEFDRVREYEEGDDPRRVDWNVTARTGRPFVKLYVEERELTVMFLLDLSASMDAGFGAYSPRRAAVRVAACLALAAIRNNDKVGLIAFSGKVDRFVAPAKGAGHALRVLRDCLAARGSGPAAAPAAALRFAARVLRRRAVVFYFSDFLGEGYEEPIRLAARRHDVIAVRLLSPELHRPDSLFAAGGLLRLTDAETGRNATLDAGSRRVREAYAARVSAWRAGVEEALRRARVDRMDVPIPSRPDPGFVAAPLHRFFRMREQRGAKR